MSSHFSVLLLITLWASVPDGLGHPLLKSQELEANDDVPAHKVRSKRCACSSLLDSECHYFCHLDIIWINTPSKTTIYGLGSVLSRRRRSSDRCTCTNLNDLTCSSFCHQRAVTSRSKTIQGGSYSGAYEALEGLKENAR